MKIYVKFKKPKTVSEFIKKFFSGGSGWAGSHAVTTYKDPECTKLQCWGSRNRSIQDLWDCVKTYYPNTKLETVVKELVKVRPQGKHFTPYRCCTIGRPVVGFSANITDGHRFPRNSTAEFSWGRLLRSIGIRSYKELLEFEKK